jgi:hypothetical protein
MSASWRVSRRRLRIKELTIAAAMEYCAEWKIAPPQWLVTAASQLLIDLLKSQKANKRGRGGGHIARYRQHLSDLNRWDAVLIVREIRARSDSEMQIVRKRPARFRNTQDTAFVKKRRDWLHHGTFACASMYVSRYERGVGPQAIRTSYRRIERKNRDPGNYRSCVFDDNFLHKLGLPGLQYTRPLAKRRSLFDMTP